MRVLSGIQPTSAPHIGNYFGAIRQFIEMQREGHEGFYFVADYHALTTVKDPAKLKQFTQDVVLDYLALGLDPSRSTLYLQSAIPEVTELAWLLSCVTGMGLLEKCHAYKDKVAKGFAADHGLFAYPVLMAADILIVNANQVPVGQDQKQHIEVARDIASSFNHIYGDVLTLPEPMIHKDVAVVPGTDGRKMSKSYGNAIEIFAEGKPLKKKIMAIVTDSKGVEEAKDPDSNNIFQLMRLFLNQADQLAWAQRFRAGHMGYGEAKTCLLDAVTEYFRPARERRAQLAQSPDYVQSVLTQGANRARAVAHETMERAKKACGLI